MVKEATRLVMFTSAGSALAGDKYYLPSPFPFPSASGASLGIVVPGPTLIHPSPDPPRQMQEGENRAGKVGGAPLT